MLIKPCVAPIKVTQRLLIIQWTPKFLKSMFGLVVLGVFSVVLGDTIVVIAQSSTKEPKGSQSFKSMFGLVVFGAFLMVLGDTMAVVAQSSTKQPKGSQRFSKVCA